MFIAPCAIVAILLDEPGSGELERRLDRASTPVYISALSRLEATLRIAARLGSGESTNLVRMAGEAVDELIRALGAREIAITGSIGQAAGEAALRYGALLGQAGGLDSIACLSYACAKAYRVPLLYADTRYQVTDLAAG